MLSVTGRRHVLGRYSPHRKTMLVRLPQAEKIEQLAGDAKYKDKARYCNYDVQQFLGSYVSCRLPDSSVP